MHTGIHYIITSCQIFSVIQLVCSFLYNYGNCGIYNNLSIMGLPDTQIDGSLKVLFIIGMFLLRYTHSSLLHA